MLVCGVVVCVCVGCLDYHALIMSTMLHTQHTYMKLLLFRLFLSEPPLGKQTKGPLPPFFRPLQLNGVVAKSLSC